MDERPTSGASGGDRAVPAMVADRWRAAAAALERWLMIFALLLLGFAGLVYAENFRWMAPGAVGRMMAPSVLAAGVLIILSALAQIRPLAASLVALALFVGNWVEQALADPAGAFRLDSTLALRLMLLGVLVVCAVRVGAAVRAVARAGGTRRG